MNDLKVASTKVCPRCGAALKTYNIAVAGVPAGIFVLFALKSVALIIPVAVVAIILALIGLFLPLKCKQCGKIPLREMPLRERRRILAGKIVTIIILVIILGAGSVVIISLNDLR